MLRCLRHLSFIVVWLSAANLASALSSPSDPVARARRNDAAQPSARRAARPTPTPGAPETQTSRPSTVVVIDAGHGGFDRGGIPGQRVAEKTMNLDVAQRLKAILTAYGYRVVMTRDSDVFVPLPTRVAIANSYPNGIFVCVHFNSATRSGANGIETYFYSRESLPLASAIHVNVAGGAPSANRGVRRRGYFVLRRTRIPAVLVECGFLTNPSEAQYALSASYRQNLAEEIARGVRGRSYTSSNASGSTRIASAVSVPLQPFIDQTRVHDPDLSRHKRSSKSRKKSSASASDTSEKKSSTKKKKKSSESSGHHDTKTKSSDTEG
jgi:N-acetylmuramoyl-L-alanine amidase